MLLAVAAVRFSPFPAPLLWTTYFKISIIAIFMLPTTIVAFRFFLWFFLCIKR
jgi:hypothetical protein